MVSLDPLVDDHGFDVADHRGQADPDLDARLAAVDRLPGQLGDLVWAYLASGCVDRAAKELGMPRSRARAGMAEAQKILRKSGAEIVA